MRIDTSDEQIASAVATLEHNAAFQETARRLAAGEGPHDMVRAMAACPAVLESMQAMGRGIYPGGNVPRELKELIILQSSIHNACQFCTQSHIDIARSLGMGEAPVAVLEDRDALAEGWRAALDWADAIRADSNRVPDALFDRLRTHFCESEVVELTFLIGYINMLNWFNNALHVRYRGELTPGD